MKLKSLLVCVFAVVGAGLAHASIIEKISIDLSTLHAGSTLSGTFSLNDVPKVGDTAPVLLTFSDPANYTPTSLSATISITSGGIGDAVRFSALSFTNPSGLSTLKNINLTVAGAAQCTSYPCTATGRFEDGSPAAFSGSYTITPAAVPEPGTGAMFLLSFAGLVMMGRAYRAKSRA